MANGKGVEVFGNDRWFREFSEHILETRPWFYDNPVWWAMDYDEKLRFGESGYDMKIWEEYVRKYGA